MPKHRYKPKVDLPINPTPRPDGEKEYTVTVWYQDAVDGVVSKWSAGVEAEDLPGAIAAGTDAIDVSPEDLIGITAMEVL